MVLGIGWALVVQPEFLRDFEFIHRLSGQPEVPYKALQFGFLGAYWFILQDLIRRYYRDDLKTVAYISAIARIVIVALVVTTVGLLPFGSSRQQQIFAFFIGIFPLARSGLLVPTYAEYREGPIFRATVAASSTGYPDGHRPATGLATVPGDETLRSALFLAVTDDEKAGPAVVGGILATFDGEVNLTHVKAFKCHEWLKDDVLVRGNITMNGHQSSSRAAGFSSPRWRIARRNSKPA